MQKKDFIQQMMISTHPKEDKFSACIDYAEKAWDALTARGYGAVEKGEPRSITDHYGGLDDHQKALFDKFWIAWGKYGAKQGAVISWMKINPDDNLAEKIIKAAKLENNERPHSKNTAKYPQGWLSERRWEDREVSTPEQGNRENEELRELKAQLQHAKQMSEYGINKEYWDSEISRIERNIR